MAQSRQTLHSLGRRGGTGDGGARKGRRMGWGWAGRGRWERGAVEGRGGGAGGCRRRLVTSLCVGECSRLGPRVAGRCRHETTPPSRPAPPRPAPADDANPRRRRRGIAPVATRLVPPPVTSGGRDTTRTRDAHRHRLHRIAGFASVTSASLVPQSRRRLSSLSHVGASRPSVTSASLVPQSRRRLSSPLAPLCPDYPRAVPCVLTHPSALAPLHSFPCSPLLFPLLD